MNEPEKLEFQYQIARQKALGTMTRAVALARLEATGMNRATAGFDLDNYLRFRSGSTSRRHSRLALTQRYLRGILEDDGPAALSLALDSLAGHIEYRESNGAREPGLRALLGRFRNHPLDSFNATRPVKSPSFKYGDKATWEMVLDEVLTFGRPVSRKEIEQRMLDKLPDFRVRNVADDLALLTVNWSGRARWPANKKPRKTDEGHRYDRLFLLPGDPPGAGLYVPFDPASHGIWRLVEVNGRFRPELVEAGESRELAEARAAAEASHILDPNVDARKHTLQAIVQREGQGVFRKALLQAYRGTCTVTGCTVEALLEAAHIVPYMGKHTNKVNNGLLLRADLHKLFDLFYFRIDPETRTVHLSPALKNSEYAVYDGVSLRLPKERSQVPLRDALKDHQMKCVWMVEGAD